ncbi:MAG TPA: hypothetical protein VIG78_02760, partial [Gemmatimonadaceae bacterium]
MMRQRRRASFTDVVWTFTISPWIGRLKLHNAALSKQGVVAKKEVGPALIAQWGDHAEEMMQIRRSFVLQMSTRQSLNLTCLHPPAPTIRSAPSTSTGKSILFVC